MKHVFGPVPSRRLGFSLGLDLIPFKTCCFDCIYCQLGRTTDKTVERRDFVDRDALLQELKEALSSKARIDYITISGSGEPTLNASIGLVIGQIKKITDKPVAVLTNGALLFKEDIRGDLLRADLVIPSLDAGSEEIFQRINRPHNDLQFGKCVEGLIQFRKEFKNEMYLEIMLVEGLNDTPDEIAKMKQIIEKIRPDKVQLNTVVRPPAEPIARPLTPERLGKLASLFGKRSEVIADFDVRKHSLPMAEIEGQIKSMVRRRPVTLDDVCSALGLHRNEVLKYLGTLQRKGALVTSEQAGKRYYLAKKQKLLTAKSEERMRR